MTGTKIIDVKVVGMCSKHGGNIRNKHGELTQDKDILCMECQF